MESKKRSFTIFNFIYLQVFSGRYDQRDDFTVVIQPFIKLFNAPDDPVRRYDEVIDISYITHDCFHFSQKGHALGMTTNVHLDFYFGGKPEIS